MPVTRNIRQRKWRKPKTHSAKGRLIWSILGLLALLTGLVASQAYAAEITIR